MKTKRRKRQQEQRVIAAAKAIARTIYLGHLGYGRWTKEERELVNAMNELGVTKL